MNLSSIFSYFFKGNNNTQNNNNQPENINNRVTVEESSDSSESILKKSEQVKLFKGELNKLLENYSVQKVTMIGSMTIFSYSKKMNNNSAFDLLSLPSEEKELLEDTNILELVHINKDDDYIFKLRMDCLKLITNLINPLLQLKVYYSMRWERYELQYVVLVKLLKLDFQQSKKDHFQTILEQVRPAFRFHLLKSTIQDQLNQTFSWDPQLLLSLNKEIQESLPALILDLKDSIKLCNTLDDLLKDFKASIKIRVVSTKEAIVTFCENTPFVSSHRINIERNKYLHETRSSLEKEAIIPAKKYFHENLVKYKNNYENLVNILNEIHPCNLNAYILVQDCLFLYQILTSCEIKRAIQEIFFSGEFQCFIDKLKSTVINIIRALLPFARDAKKFFGTELFGEENESHIKDILNPQENPYASYENDLRKKLEEQWNEAEKEEVEKEKKLQKEEKIKNSNQSKISQKLPNNKQKNDQEISTKTENNNNQPIFFSTETKLSRSEEKQKSREELEWRKKDAQKEKEENLKKLIQKNDSNSENIISDSKIKLTSINQPKSLYLIPSRQYLDEKILKNLNNSNQQYFKALFDLDQSEITHHNILNLAQTISDLLSKNGYHECAENFLNDIKNHIHPNHGTGQGSIMSIKHKYCIRTYFILSGIIPLEWEPSLDNLQAFSYYEQKMKALANMKRSDNSNK